MYRSPDGDPAGGVNLDVFSEFLDAGDTPPAPADDSAAGGDDGKKPETPAGGDKKDETPKPADQTKSADELLDLDDADGKKDEEGDGGADDAEKDDVLPPITDEEAQEGSWADVAEQIGIDKPENGDDFEGFKANVTKKLTAEYERGKAEGKAEAVSADLSKYSPDVRLAIDAMNGGAKISDILSAGQPFNEVLANPDDTLYKMYLMQTLKMPEEKADEQIATLQENGTFDVESAKIRAAVTQKRDEIVNDLIGKSAKAWEDEQARILNEKKAFDGKVKTALDGRKEFLGGKLADSHRQGLLRMWENGTFEQSLKNDPDAVVDFMLYRQFGKDRLAKMKDTISGQTKLEQLKKQSNVPSTTPGGEGGRSKAKASSGNDDDDVFGGVNEFFTK